LYQYSPKFVSVPASSLISGKDLHGFSVQSIERSIITLCSNTSANPTDDFLDPLGDFLEQGFLFDLLSSGGILPKA
jgi:hypothetical protein